MEKKKPRFIAAQNAAKELNASPVYDMMKPRWDARGPRFRIPEATKSESVPRVEVMLMNDPEPVMVHSVVRAYSAKRGYPDRETVRCSAYICDEEGQIVETGKPCLYCQALKRSYMALFMQLIVLSPVTTKTGVQMTSGLSSTIISARATRDAITRAVTVGAERGKLDPTNLAGAVFDAMRGSGKTDAATGTEWQLVEHCSLKAPKGDASPALKYLRRKGFDNKLVAKIVEERKANTLDVCYPLDTPQQQLLMLSLHMKAAIANPTVDHLDYATPSRVLQDLEARARAEVEGAEVTEVEGEEEATLLDLSKAEKSTPKKDKANYDIPTFEDIVKAESKSAYEGLEDGEADEEAEEAEASEDGIDDWSAEPAKPAKTAKPAKSGKTAKSTVLDSPDEVTDFS